LLSSYLFFFLGRCVKVEAREATDEELRSVHTESHVELMKAVSSRTYGRHGRKGIAKRYNSIYFNEGSSESALLAAGSVIEVSDQVAQGKLKAGAAIVRPPGHHAEADAAMGFCLFNNVAIAAHLLVHEKKQLGVQKLLIVDWDVHHGNGTQHMFWSDPQVLYFSVHRFDDGSFYPAGDEGNYDHVGVGKGAGYNINIPWPHGQFGDADYLAVWEHVLMPVARKYNPDMVLISAGFDSAEGDPLGECRVTPTAYFKMTKQLMEIAEGRVVIALEGGYNLKSISNSYLACMHALLGDAFLENPTHLNNLLAPTLPLIEKVQNELQKYWPVLSINQKELATVDIERELLAEREEIQLKPEVEYSVSEEMPITDLIELLAKLSTDGHVATDGTEALLDSYNQPNSPQGTQSENLDAATSSVPDLPGGKDPTNLKVGPEIIFSETGDINLLDKDSEEHMLEIQMGQTAQGSNGIIHNSSAMLDYNLLEDISSKGGGKSALWALRLKCQF
jgi:acetoin utilization deacetylase AcuC-like enzyme